MSWKSPRELSSISLDERAFQNSFVNLIGRTSSSWNKTLFIQIVPKNKSESRFFLRVQAGNRNSRE